MAAPDRRQIPGVIWRGKPGLRVDGRAVVVRGVDQLIGAGEANRVIPGGRQVTAPPVGVGADPFDPFHDDEPVGVDAKDGVSGALSRHPPVSPRVAVAPGRGSMWLVMQVGRDHRRLRPVAARQHRPVVDPAGLGHAIRIPEFALSVSTGPMSIQDNRQACAPGALCNNLGPVAIASVPDP